METIDPTELAPLTPDQLILGGRMLAGSLDTTSALAVRRVEQVHIGGTHAARSVSVDWVLPESGAQIPVPVACLSKVQPPPVIEALDSGGRVLPLLSAGEGARAAHLALMLMVGDDSAWAPSEEHALFTVAAGPPEHARAALDYLTEQHPEWFSSVAFASLALFLSTSRIVWVLVDPRSAREVVKVRWDSPLAGGGRRAIVPALTGRAASLLIELAAVPGPGAYHLEAAVPHGLEITRATLNASGPASSHGLVSSTYAADGFGRRAHVYSPGGNSFGPDLLALEVEPTPQITTVASIGSGVTAIALGTAVVAPAVSTDGVLIPVLVAVMGLLGSSLAVTRRSGVGRFGAFLGGPVLIAGLIPLAACLYLLIDTGAAEVTVLAGIGIAALGWLANTMRWPTRRRTRRLED